jgi:regulatory protein
MLEITALKESGDAVVVELDGRPWRTVSTTVAARAGLSVGKLLERQDLRLLRRELRRAQALSTATAALQRRAYSKRTLEQRLERRGFAPAARETAMETLERAGYVDDESYARTRALGLAGRGYSDQAIRFTLEREGIGEEPVWAAIAELSPEPERAARVLESQRDRRHGLALLARRGFASDTIEEIASRERP